jgi:hypothetical protein
MDGIIAGAAAVGARLVYGDNLYGYGPVSGPFTEGLPHRATGPNALVVLGEREEAVGQVWHVPSANTVTTRRLVEVVFEQAVTAPRLRVAPKLGITVLALVNPTMRAVNERLYQTERPFVVDHGQFERAFGATPTPHPEAIERTLAWYRSLGS